MVPNYGACIAMLALVPACFHVTLDPVPRSATSAQRVAAYRRLRPASQTRTVTVHASQHGVSVDEETSMALADGTDVHHADDLLPVVDRASPTARAAYRSRSARYGKWFFGVSGAVAFLGGAVLVLDDMGDDDLDETGSGTMTYVGGGVAIAGAIMMLVSRLYYTRAEEHARRAAFATYDESLRDTLRVCVDGLQVIDCQASPPGLSSPR